MLQFPDEYFCEEEKYGFIVSKTMKHAWAAHLELLSRLMEICRQYDITCYATWGTLIGAVRHKGFIPWDDDVDIAMKRPDYMKFLQVVQKQLPEEFCVLNIYNEIEYPNTFTRLTNSHTIDVSPARLNAYHGCPFIVGIDIYPFDYIPRDPQKAELQRQLWDITGQILSLAKYVKEQTHSDISPDAISEDSDAQDTIRQSMDTVEEGLQVLEEVLDISVDRTKDIPNEIRKIYDQICMMYSEEESDIIASVPQCTRGWKCAFPKEWFEVTQLPFENIMVDAPVKYREILEMVYGDYMKPVRGGGAHGYPFYKEQLQMLHERGMWLDVKE